MELYLVILAALAPVAVALLYVFRKDSLQPEPTTQLAKAFGFGVLSVFLSFVFSFPLSEILGAEIDEEEYSTILDALADAFFGAAIPEEVAKLIMLWLLLRTNRFFDEKFDGIIYAVFISMGFAALENVMYLFEGLEDGSWVITGIVRALFSIPGHFLFAVLMGYYYSIYHFGIDRSRMTMVKIIAAPVLAHGIFDAILMSSDIDEEYAAFFMLLFLVFFFILKRMGKKRIASLRNQ